MSKKTFFYSWGPVIIWCLVIFILSSIPTLPAPKIIWWDFILKKSAHIIEYGILYFLVFRAVNDIKLKAQNSKVKTSIKNTKPNYLTPFIFAFFYSVSDEIHQYFVPGRHCKIYDIGFDFLGMWLASRYFILRFLRFL